MALAELRKLTKDSLSGYSFPDTGDDYVPSGDARATWWVQKTQGTTYWRCTVPAKSLPGQALHLRYPDLSLGDDGEVLVSRQRGTSIWQFVGNATRALIMAHLQDQGVRVLMEVDDNYLASPPMQELGEWKTKIDRSPQDHYSFQAHRKIIQWVDGVIVSTARLGEHYAKATQAPIYHCPNSIDLDDWPGHSEGLGRAGTGDSDARVIGYAASGSHRHDLSLVERGLDWAWRQPNVTLYALGLPFPERIPHKRFEWAEMDVYRQNLRVLDVGLCPLKRGVWHDGKSDIKAMEYLLSGAVPIVQRDSPCYQDWIDIVPSAATEKEWLKAMRWAVQAPREELQDAWQRGYDFLLKNKLIEQHIEKWRRAVA